MSPSNTATPITALLSFCIQQMLLKGFDLGEVLARSGLDAKTCNLPQTVMTREQEVAVYSNIERLIGAAGLDDFGLTMGGQVNVNTAGMLGGLVANALDLGHAGYLLRRYQILSNRWFTPEFIGTLAPGKTVVRYRQTGEPGILYRLMMDLSVRGTQHLLTEVFGPSAAAFISAVDFGYPKPDKAEHYAAELQCPVSFGHDFTYVTFDEDIGKLSNPKRSEFAYQLFLQYCREGATRYGPTSWQQKVLNSLSCIDGYPSAGTMAETLNCSERSLRRHLNSEGVQYSELIDRIRFDRAVYLLSHSSDSIKTIGYQLSYSEPAAFIHAFSRWTGSTPTEFRRANSGSEVLA